MVPSPSAYHKKKVIGRLDITNGAESKTYTPQPNSGRENFKFE